jgi:hypothetical protein
MSNAYVNISRIQKFGKIFDRNMLMLNCFSNKSQVKEFFFKHDNNRFGFLANFAD